MTKTAQKLFISSAALVAAEKKMEENRAKKMVWAGHEVKGQLEQADTPPISPSNWKPAFLDVDKKQQEASKILTGEAVDTVKSKAHQKKALAGEATKAKARTKSEYVNGSAGQASVDWNAHDPNEWKHQEGVGTKISNAWNETVAAPVSNWGKQVTAGKAGEGGYQNPVLDGFSAMVSG
ncbi:unnamed protein product [Amoebophrya sp. A120]|nr:unnamed protein product [Amoebophrya sp. A120]|eukprot:GSA120T00014443001.1